MKRLVMISFLVLFLFIFNIQIITNLLYNPLFIPDISFLFQKVYAQKWVFITPGASQSNNNDPFVPPMDIVSAGTIVTWTNEDSTTHTVTSDNSKAPKTEYNEKSLFDSGPISPGSKFDNAFDSVEVFGYHCTIHPFMRGSVVVN